MKFFFLKLAFENFDKLMNILHHIDSAEIIDVKYTVNLHYNNSKNIITISCPTKLL